MSNFIKLRLFIVFIIAAINTNALSDVLYLRDEVTARKIVNNFNPDARESQIESAFSEYEHIKEMLESAPAFSNPDTGNKYYYVNVIEHLPGLRIDNMDASQYDRFAIRALGQGGERVGPEEILLSALWVQSLIHEFDTPKDFEWYFSNHHVVEHLVFGSDAHRQVIYQLVDPEGFAGLPVGDAVTSHGEIRHGRVTKFLLTGFPSQKEYYASNFMSVHSPRMNGPVMTVDETVNSGNARHGLGLFYLIRAMALAEKYDTFDSVVGEMAKEAFGLICTLMLADPNYADESQIRIVERAHYLGQACRREIFLNLELTLRAFKDGKAGAESGYFRFSDGTALPIESRYALNPILDVMLKEDVFRIFPGVEVLDPPGGPLEVMTNAGPEGRSSTTFFETIVDIATSKNAIEGIQDIRAKALGVIERLVFPLDGDSAEEREKYEIDQRAYQQVLYSRTAHNNKLDWYFTLMCRKGWGYERPARAFALDRISVVGELVDKDWDGELGPEGRQKMNMGLMQIAIMRRSASSDNTPHVVLRELIDGWIERIKKDIEYFKEHEQIGTFVRFIANYENYLAADLGCQQSARHVQP